MKVMKSPCSPAAPILACFLALGLLCGCQRSHSTTEGSTTAPSPVDVQVVLPRKGDIARRITLPGEIKAYQQATLYAKVAGYLKTIAVDKGDAVKEGALLAERSKCRN